MTWRVRLREGEGEREQPFLSPDLLVVVDPVGAHFDLALADADETTNRGGLRSKAAIDTAVILQVFSDARARESDMVPDALDPDPRGWWGDGVARPAEQGDFSFGSRLWLYRRSVLNDATVQAARDAVMEALQPIVDQGAVASFDVVCRASTARADPAPETGVLEIDITGFGRDGAAVYQQKFDVLWKGRR
jgi:phage gp46-like protein